MTKQAPYQHADGSNCWTKDCRLGNRETGQARMDAWIQDSITAEAKADQTAKTLLTTLVRDSNEGLDYDDIKNELQWILQWEEAWTDGEIANLKAVEKIALLVENDPFTPQHEAAVGELISNLSPVRVRLAQYGRSRGWNSNDTSWRARDKILHSLAKNLLTRRLADNLVEPIKEPADNPHLLGLTQAQDFALKNLNYALYYQQRGTSHMGKVEPFFQNAIARVASGEELSTFDNGKGEDGRSLFPEHERIFSALHPDSGDGNQQLYLASVFPVKELKDEMDRAGIDGVSVSPFYNTREWGNAYTVVTPTGETRTFSVYEHRNTDSIIINGSSNWNGEDLPYSGDSKNSFFAEFRPDDKVRAAQALTFYLMQAQDGDLESDESLASKATKRDWNAILDASIPGFKAWRQGSIEDRYIAPEDEKEDDILSRLDF